MTEPLPHGPAFPILSVVVFAYNHGPYIARSISSILEQKFSFSAELLIYYTASADNTREEAAKTIEGHSWARIVDLEKGQDFFRNSAQNVSRLNGKYVIFVDGDDYWNGTEQLELKVQFLEKNPDYSGVFNDAEIFSEEIPVDSQSATYKYYLQYRTFSQFNNYSKDYNAWDAVHRLVIPPSSLMIRTETMKAALPKLIPVRHSGMWMITLFLLHKSKFRYFNHCWTIYRNHAGGITKTDSHTDFIKANIHVLRHLLKDPHYYSFRWDIYKSIAREYEMLLFSADGPKSRWKKLKVIAYMLKYSVRFHLAMFGRVARNDW